MSLARLSLCADTINAQFSNYSLLDLGCRTMDLRPLLSECDSYMGTDLVDGEGVVQCDLEKPLSMKDKSYDIVVLLDVLEHLNNPHQAVREACRVARKAVYVSLPNMFYIQFRWNFLIGRGISGKYTFHPHPIIDRHRWVMSYDEAVNFVDANADEHPVCHQMIIPTRGRTRRITTPIENLLSDWMPNLFAYGLLSEIRTDSLEDTRIGV